MTKPPNSPPNDSPSELPDDGSVPDRSTVPDGVEDNLRSSLKIQADRFEPSRDSFVRLEQRLANEESATGLSYSFGPRLMAAAAGILLLLGTAGYFSFRPESQQLATSTPTTEQADEEVADAVEVMPGEEDGAAAEPSIDYPSAVGNVAGPKADSPLEAASAFLALVRVEVDFELGLSDSSNEVKVYAETDSGVRSSLATTLTIAMTESSSSTGTSYFVTSASSASVTLASLPNARIVDDHVSITGVATGWPGDSATMKLYSSNNGVLLGAEEIVLDTGSSVSEFSSPLRLAGRDHGWVVVQTTAASGDSLGSFAAVPIFFDSPHDEYQVAHIDVNDPDGLHVRRLPGTDGEIIDSLAPGTTGIYRQGDVPSQGTEGRYEWWPIEYGDDQTGWVNARYLAAIELVSDKDLEAIASWFIEASTGPLGADDLASDREIWPDEQYKPVQVGWVGAMTNLSGDELATLSTWDDETREWGLPAAAGDFSQVTSLRDFLGLGEADELTVDVANREWVYGLDQQAADSNFAGLSNVTIAPPFDGDNLADRQVTLYVEQTEAGPVIVGIAVWLWTP